MGGGTRVFNLVGFEAPCRLLLYYLIMCDINKIIETCNKTKHLVAHYMPDTEIRIKPIKMMK